jgi:hypothetical protein
VAETIENDLDVLRHLALIVSPWPSDPRKALFVMLSFAVDASGDESTRILSVAGFGSSEQDWREFSRLWTARLEKDGLPYFRAVDAAHFRGPFAHWHDKPDRDKLRELLFGDLMSILKSHVYRKFGCSIINSEFKSMSEELRGEFALTAYSVAGRTVEKKVREWINAEWTTHTPVAIVFEDGDKGKGKLIQRLHDDGCFLPTFRPKKDTRFDDGTVVHGYTPLQAADWLAYELSLSVQWMEDDKAHQLSDFRWPMQEFVSIPGPLGTYTASDINGLEKGLALAREIKWREQSAETKDSGAV